MKTVQSLLFLHLLAWLLPRATAKKKRQQRLLMHFHRGEITPLKKQLLILLSNLPIRPAQTLSLLQNVLQHESSLRVQRS